METVRNLTVEQARDMINSIDTSLIPECRDFDTYTETDDIWRIGDYGYVDADVYEQAFRDYEERNGKTEWASTMYVLEGNQPTRLGFFVEAYNLIIDRMTELRFQVFNKLLQLTIVTRGNILKHHQ